jgi:hypothetical protein
MAEIGEPIREVTAPPPAPTRDPRDDPAPAPARRPESVPAATRPAAGR